MPVKRVRLFDSHLHIIHPEFSLIENQGFLPDPFTCDDYRNAVAGFDVIGGVIVSGSFQGYDQAYLLDAMGRLGSTFVGVTQIPPSISDADIKALNNQGVRGIRFNLVRGSADQLTTIESMGNRVFHLAGWHVELYVDSNSLAELVPTLLRMPAVSIDHLGLSREGLPTLLSLVEGGVRVKATGFGRVTMDVRQAIRSIVSINPSALMFGTDLPSTRAPRRFQPEDVNLVLDTLPNSEVRDAVMFKNALEWYRIPSTPKEQ